MEGWRLLAGATAALSLTGCATPVAPPSDQECAVLAAAGAAVASEPGFKTDDVSRIAVSSSALAPPPGGDDPFKGFRRASGRRDLADCPGWLAQMKADNRTVVTPTFWQIARPGPSRLEWFSRPAFAPSGKAARVIYGKGDAWGGIIMTFRLTESGWVEDDDRELFITTR